jgi:DNA processing protein
MTDQPCAEGEEERLARAALTRLAEPAEPCLAAAVEARGAVHVYAELRRGRLALFRPRPGGGVVEAPDVTAGMQARLKDADPERDLAVLERHGGRLLCPGDREWPRRLADLGMASPLALWVRGPVDLAVACEQSVAVVGARASSEYGNHMAGELGVGLGERDWCVLSGGAYGVDGAAHRGALAVGGTTVAVLAGGVDVTYPRGHAVLLARIAESGALISELPPGCAPMRHRFLVRNRLIAAITAGTVVVEAAARSGALSTARAAARLNRPLGAVPGPVTSSLSAGCHQLLRDGLAVCVTRAQEVLELVGPVGEELAEVPRGLETARDRLDEEAKRVLDAVPVRTPVPVERLAAVAGLQASAVARQLPSLVARGLVTREPAGWRLATGPDPVTASPEGAPRGGSRGA